jgi:hypothetical protein
MGLSTLYRVEALESSPKVCFRTQKDRLCQIFLVRSPGQEKRVEVSGAMDLPL